MDIFGSRRAGHLVGKLPSCSTCKTITVHVCTFFFLGKDDYLFMMKTKTLSSEEHIFWNDYNLEICSQVLIPADQEVKVGVNIYDASKSEFSFPEDVSVKSYVYQIRVTTVQEQFISGIQVTLTNLPPPQGKECIHALEASGNPTGWASNFIPLFSFSQIEAPRFHYHNRTVKIMLSSTLCYLAIAGE